MNEEYARIDFNRRERIGMVEAVWGQHKTAEQIVAILKRFHAEGEFGLVTRVSAFKAEAISNCLANVVFHPTANCLTYGEMTKSQPSLGKVIILCGGTSDLRIAAESELALQCHGIKVELIVDVGVAGLNRLLNSLPRLKTANVLIACAGMEGSLPTVLTGLVPQPVIGVPTSVGYGVSSGGKVALEGMLSSCAPGLTVVNIDNGYGAAMAALRILKFGSPSS